MSQRQRQRIEKSDKQTQYRVGSRSSRAYSTSKPKYQWVSSTKVTGRGGESDNTGLPHPPPPSDTYPSTNNINFSNVEKSDGRHGGQSSIIPGAISESNAVQKNAPFENPQLSGSSTSKPLPKRTTSWYRKRDAQIVPETVSSQSQSEVSTSPVRDGLSRRAFLPLENLQDFENGMVTQNGNPQLQSKDLKHLKNGTCQLRSKAKRNVHMNDNSSITGETDKSSISSKQLPMQDHEQSENENPHLRPKFDLELSKENMKHFNNETSSHQQKKNLRKPKNEAPHLQFQGKRHIHFQQQKSSEPGVTAPKQEAKRYVEKFSAKPPRLRAQEDLEESKNVILHLQPKVQRQQQNEDLIQCKKGTPNFHLEAEREKHHLGISALTLVNNAQDVCDVPEAPIPTSLFQQFQMPVQLSSRNPFQVPQPPFVPSLRPYPLQHQGLMHYDDPLNFSPHIGHHLGPQFGINGINPNHAQNYLKKPTSRAPVKITHPETKEELILDNSATRSHASSSGTMAHYPMGLQPEPIPYGPSFPLNYFSHEQMKSFPFQSPTSMPLRRPQMTFRTSSSGFNSPGVHDETVATNATHPSSASLPILGRASSFTGENEVTLSAGSATNDRNQATKPIDPQNVGCQLGKANYYAEGSVQKPEYVVPSSPKVGEVAKDTSTGINENGITATGHHQYATAKEPWNLSQKCDLESHKFPQAETSTLVDNSDMKSSEVGECHNNTIAPSKDIQQSDTIFEPLPSSGSSTPVSSRLETINLEANHSSVGTCESSLSPPQVGLPAVQVGLPCTSEVPCQLQTGKDLIDTASSLQVDAKTEDLFEQDGTNLFDQPVPQSICKDGNPINPGSLQLNQQTNKGSVDMWNSIAERTGDALVDGSVSNSIMLKGASFTGKQRRHEVPNEAGAAWATDNPCRVYEDYDAKLPSSGCTGTGHIFSMSNEKNFGANKNVEGKSELGYQEGVENSNLRHAALDDVQISGRKRYSRDFLLKLSKQVTDFPSDFQFAHDMAESLIICHNANMEHIVDHTSDSSYVPNVDGLAGSSSVHHHSHRKDAHHRWTKPPTHIATERRFGFNGESSTFHPAQGGRKGRNLNYQVHALQYARGSITGVFPCPPSRGGRTRKGAGVEKDFVSFQSTMRSMHKADKKYEVNKAIDAEEAKQRQLKAILNKLTPQNFDRLFQQVKEVNIDNAVTLAGLISQIFDKALMEPTFSEMYANFCHHLASELPDFVEGDEKITFKRLLLNKCQEEFERGEKEQEEEDKPDTNGVVKLSEEKRVYARRRMLGNITLIGELYKKKMLTERIMHECIEKLLRHDQLTEEEGIEALCKLMSTIGKSIDHPKAKDSMDSYFELMLNLSNNIELSTRMRFMLKDVIDLRKNKWQERIKAEGPKKLEELHSDAAQEVRTVGNQLMGSPKGPNNKRASATLGSQQSNFRSTKKSEKVVFRAISSKNHGNESHDMRSEDRKHQQQGALSVPLQQDDNITTVGLKRDFKKGMPLKEPTMFHSSPAANSHSSIQKFRKVPANTSGHSSITELRPDNNLKQKLTPKHAPDNFMQAPLHSPSNQQGYYVNDGSTSGDGSLGRSSMTKMIYPSMISSEKGCSDEYFKENSVAAIQEFYSAGNENDIFNYVENLNSPSFNPSLISIWVKDSFQRNDKETDLLVGLLISLTKSRAGGLTTRQLIKGFELVLATPEVALADAAKAAAFLGKLFGKIVTKNVISLKEIKRMVQQSGKVPGQSPESKLGFEVMQIALQTIQLERGESGLKGMCKRFNVRLDDFHPSTTVKP